MSDRKIRREVFMPRKQRIAILGGGIASLTTAYELTNSPDWKNKYDITIYQQGHRLGGKCASSRVRKEFSSGTVERIEEHGLHVFFGFYENAFSVMRGTYAEHDRLPRVPGEQRRLGFSQAFLPHDLVMLGTDLGSTLHSWSLPFPRRDGQPGVPDAHNPTTIDGGAALAGLVELIVAQWLEVADIQVDGLGAAEPGANELEVILEGLRGDGIDEDIIADTLRIMKAITRVLRGSVDPRDVVRALRATQAVLLRLGRAKALRKSIVRNFVANTLRSLRKVALVALAPLPSGAFRVHELRTSVDLALSLAIGLVSEDLLHADVDWHALDGEDYRVWLERHGACQETVRSAPLLTLAAAAFSDPVNAGAGAGTTLRLTLRLLLTYKHAVLFRLGAGMGEVVIAPMFRVLEARGVKFKFFHRVERLVPGRHQGEPVVSRIDMRVQATVKRGATNYRPLAPFAGTLCWPEWPLYEQLDQGEALKQSGENLESSWNRWDIEQPIETLELGKDYDAVVCGISLGGLQYVAKELAADSDTHPLRSRGPKGYVPRFSEMIDRVRTVETMGVQLWFESDFRGLGAPAHRGIGIAYPQPFDTWAEMDHLLAHERWHVPKEPATLVYLCSALDEPSDYEPPPHTDHTHPDRQKALVKRIAKRWLDEHGGRVFTKARLPGGGFDYDMLVDPAERAGEARFDAQFYCTTMNTSDRYVLAAPGTTRSRLRPHESGFINLILTGDWTLNSVSAGCVESAVTSGRDAARAMIGGSVRIVDDWLTRVKPWLLCDPILPRLPTFGEEERKRPVLREILGGASEAPPPAIDPSVPQHSGVQTLPLPAYLRRPFDVIPRPNYVCKDTRTDWFFFHGKREALQDLVDEMLNFQDSPTQYRVMAPMVAFVAAQLGYTYPDRERLGYMPEKDFAFWIPVVATAKPGRECEHKASPLGWLQPVLWVDSCPAVVGGRDVFGVNKALADLRAPSEHSHQFSVDTVAVTKEGLLNDQGEPVSRAQMERLLELRVDRELDVWDVLHSFAGFRNTIAGRVDLGALGGDEQAWLGSLFEEMRDRTMPLVALKQFPDIENANLACYKAVIEAPSRVTELRKVRPWPGTHELCVYPFDSHPIVSRFGLTGEKVDEGGVVVTKVKSFFAVSMEFDFVLDEGKVIFDVVEAHANALARRRAAAE